MSKKSVISLTANAANYIEHKLQAELPNETERQQAGLRISLKKGGCSGQEYDFKFVPTKQPSDEEVIEKNLRIYIDPAAFLNILGSTMDYQDDPFSSGLIFINPNETNRCGCGKSVRFDIEQLTPPNTH